VENTRESEVGLWCYKRRFELVL